MIMKAFKAYTKHVFVVDNISFKVAITREQMSAIKGFEKRLDRTLKYWLISKSAVTGVEFFSLGDDCHIQVVMPAAEVTPEMLDHVAYIIKNHTKKCEEQLNLALAEAATNA